MPLFEAVRMALSTIWAQKLKSFFSLIGVLIGVTFLIAVVSIVQGMNVYMEDQFANKLVGLNTFQVLRRPIFQTGDISSEVRREWARRPFLTHADADYLADRIRTPVQFSRQCEGGVSLNRDGKVARDINYVAAEATYFDIKNYEIAHGRAFTPQEVRAGLPVLVIGDLVAEKLFEGLDPVGRDVQIGGIPYRIVGVVARQGTLFGIPLDKFAVAPFTAPGRRLVCAANIIEEFNVQAANVTVMQQAMREVETLLRARRGLRPADNNNFHLQTAEGALERWRTISAVLFAALPGLVAISLVVGGIVIMNIMLMAVSERTREIGVRKALGARRGDILAQFVVESATLSTVGAIFGIGFGIVLAFTVRSLTPFPAAIAPWSIGVAVFLGVAVGMTAGIYPASRASRLDPIDALRAE